MSNLDPEANRLYARAEDLHGHHWEALARREPAEAAQAAGATWDGRAFRLPVLGRLLRVEPEALSVRFDEDSSAGVGYQRALVAVSYLGSALEAPTSGRFVAFRELPGGDSFFRGPHALATGRLEEAYGGHPAALVTAADGLGGVLAAGADAAVEFPALPRIPLQAFVWGRTDEFPPRAALLVEARAHLHLALDVLWALSNVAISALVGLRP